MAQKFDLLIAAKTTGQQAIKRMGNAMQGLQGRLKNVRMAALGVTSAFAALGAIAALTGFARTTKTAIDQADAFGKLSRQTGVAADTLQSYVNAGKLAGVEQTAIDKGLARLASSIREADQGVATYKDSFDALGISVRDSEGNLKSTEQVFGEISDRFADMPAGTTKAALAMELFSRQGRKLIPLLDEGSAALNEWNYETSEGFAANAEYFNDQLTMLGFGFDGFRKQMADQLLPTLNAVAEVFREMFSAENDWEPLFMALDIAVRGIATALLATVNLLDETIRQFKMLVDVFIKLGHGDWEGAGDVFNEWTGGVGERFEQNMARYEKLILGSSEATEDYAQNVGELGDEFNNTFGTSMKAKLDSFAKSMNDFGGMVADVVIKAFKGLEDQLVSFVTTGKLEFKKLAQSIIADMARIAIRATIIKPIMAGFGITAAKGAVLENGQHLTAYAKGGVVTKPTIFPMANGMGLMGEAGPEAILPLKRRNGVLGVEGGGNSNNVVVNVDASGSKVQGDQEEGRILGKLIAAAVQATLIKEQRPGGLLAA